MAKNKHKLLTISAAFDGTLATWWSDAEFGNANRVLMYHPDMSIGEIAKLYEADGYRYEVQGADTEYPQHRLILIEATEGDFLAERARAAQGFAYTSSARLGMRFAEYVKNERPEICETCLSMAHHQMDGAVINQGDKDLFWQAVREYADSVGFPVRDGFVDGFADEMLKD